MSLRQFLSPTSRGKLPKMPPLSLGSTRFFLGLLAWISGPLSLLGCGPGFTLGASELLATLSVTVTEQVSQGKNVTIRWQSAKPEGDVSIYYRPAGTLTCSQGTLLSTLALPSNTYNWSTSGLAEGSYALCGVLNSGGERFVSADALVQVLPYCSLERLTNSVTENGSGTALDPYVVCSLLQLQSIRTGSLSASYRLGTDIDASETINWDDGNGAPNEGFNPLGTFTGSFDGGGHTITGMYINRPTASVGLFTTVNNPSGEIKDLKLKDVNINGDGSVGALVGSVAGATIRRISVSGVVVGKRFGVGGIIGDAGAFGSSVLVDTCTSSASVTGLTAAAANVGGLVGATFQGVTIEKSQASGTITAPSNARGGGLVGYMFHVTVGSAVRDSRATGDVLGPSGLLGGLAGEINGSPGGSIERCYATGNVGSPGNTGSSGGLVAQISGPVTDSYATGNVEGETRTGGLIGWPSTDTILTRVYASGNVIGNGTPDEIGGLLGLASNGTGITDSFSTGAVTGGTNTGGLIGRVYAGGPAITGISWYSFAGNPGVCIGTDNRGVACSAQGLANYQSFAAPPLSNWDFVGDGGGTADTWKFENAGDLPSLNYAFEFLSAP